MAPRANRRWLVAAIYGVYGILQLIAWMYGHGIYVSFYVTLMFTLVIGPLLGGYSSVSTSLLGEGGLVEPFDGREVLKYPEKPKLSYWWSLFDPQVDDDPGLKIDERSRRRHDEAHAYGFRKLSSIITIIFMIELFFLTGSPFQEDGVFGIKMSVETANRIVLYLIQIGFLFSSTLTPAILLWSEPDMEEEREEPVA
jgi:hypothetical protein